MRLKVPAQLAANWWELDLGSPFESQEVSAAWSRPPAAENRDDWSDDVWMSIARDLKP
jgi:hypothetical protein